ncbi:unnamed protein product [Didymodactylos carnosus]|uniref:Uncharacterized protein n=1 Tax=Didymodactylos carnosus TaxID=1234261 RepID=A0A815LL82_9BILA|nr:unnamed protein product [Didymodactylos carnosus]CAF4299114.1 unnamed protein product [Didymodactylos carnosus]
MVQFIKIMFYLIIIELFTQFDLLIYEKYQYLASNVETDSANLVLNVKRKNRILNITFKYLSNILKETNIESIEFERNELINTMLAIKNTFETNKLQLQDKIHNIWESEVKDNNTILEIIDYIIRYSKEKVKKYNLQTSLNCLVKEFIKNINSIKMFKLSVDTLYFFDGYENFIKLTNIIQLKVIDSNSMKLKINKLTDVFCLLTGFDDFNSALKLLDSFEVDNWLLYLNINKIEYDLNMLFHQYLDEFNLNDMKTENLNNLDEFIESKLNETEIKYDNSLKKISNTIKVIELNGNTKSNEKEMVFDFLKIKIIF